MDDRPEGSPAHAEDCLPKPEVDYDTRRIGAVRGDMVTRWANAGTLGGAWDLDGVVGEGHIFLEASDAPGASGPALAAHNGSVLFMTRPATSLEATVLCMVVTLPFATDNSVYLQWSTEVEDRNLLRGLVKSGGDWVEYMGGGQDFMGAVRGLVFPARHTQVEAICLDLTDPTAIRHSVSGRATAPFQFGDQSGSGFRQANRFSVGADLDPEHLVGVSGCQTCFYHRIVAYEGTPDLDLHNLSKCLYEQWR